MATSQGHPIEFVQDHDRVVAVVRAHLPVGQLQAPLGAKARVVFSAVLHGHALTARDVTD